MAKTAIVVGGGIAGCSTAYALARRSINVTLIERNVDIASEASGNPLAMLYPRLSGDDSISKFALAGYCHSLALFKTLNLNQTQFHQCGMLQLGFNSRELARIKKVASQNYPLDILRYVTKDEASALAGVEIDHDALYFPTAAWVNPQQLCQRLTEHESISVVASSHITGISKINHQFEVIGDDGFLAKADIAVIANANDAQKLCPKLPFNTQAVRGQVSLLDADETSCQLQTIVCSDGYLSPASSRQDARYLHCLGATFSSEPIRSAKHQDLHISDEDHLANLNKLQNISPLLHANLKNDIVGGRVSLRCTTPDYLPLVGQLLNSAALKAAPPRPNAAVESLPWIAGLYINVAHGSKGFTTAPLCAELLACMISNNPLPVSTELTGLLNPNRFLLREMGLKRLAKII